MKEDRIINRLNAVLLLMVLGFLFDVAQRALVWWKG